MIILLRGYPVARFVKMSHTFSDSITGFVAIFVVSLASFIGVITLSWKSKKLPQLYDLLIPFATGTLIGTVIYHLLPESVEISGEFSTKLGTLVIIGITFPFILEKGVNWHHHHALEHSFTDDDKKETNGQIKSYVFVNLTGDALHNFADGAVLIATFSVSTELGIAAFFGILIHELAQELGDFSILIQGGLETRKAILWNFLSALTAFLGGIVALIFEPEILEEYLLPIAAGSFLYLAVADIIPELHQKVQRRDWILQLGIGGIGVALMFLLTYVE